MRGILPGTAIAIRRINTNDRSVDEPISFYSMKDASGFLKRSEDYVSHRIKDGKLILSNNPDELKRQWYVVEKIGKDTVNYLLEMQEFLSPKPNEKRKYRIRPKIKKIDHTKRVPNAKLILRRIDVLDHYLDSPLYFKLYKDAESFLNRGPNYIGRNLHKGELILSEPTDKINRQWYVVERNDKQTTDYFKEAQKFLVRKFNYSEDLPVLAKEQVAKFNREKNEQEKLSAKERQRKIKYYLHKLDLKYIDLAEAANKDDEDFKTLQTLLGVR